MQGSNDAKGSEKERRESVRYELQGRVWFRWRSADGDWHDGSGAICNICCKGAYVVTEVVPPLTAQLQVMVTFPVAWATDAEVRLSGFGDVRHVTRGEGERSGYGASLPFRMGSSGDTSQ